MSWKEYYIYSANFTSLAAGSGSSFTDLEIRIDTDAEFEFIKTIFQPVTARARVRYKDDSSGRFLMKGEPDIRTIGGTRFNSFAPSTPRLSPGFIPFIWPIPYIISAATTLTVSAADFSGLSYDFRISFHGSKIRPQQAPWAKKYKAVVPYVYKISNTNTVTLAANGTASVSIPTDIDAHFVVRKIVGSRTGPALVTVKDGARDRQWMDVGVHIDNFIGNGMFPNILPSPRFIYKGSIINTTIQDLSGASNEIEINYIGEKLYE